MSAADGVGLTRDQGLEVAPEDVHAARMEGACFRLLDCREEDEYRLCHLEGSEWVPLASLSQWQGFRDLDEPIVVYCHHGMRSLQAVAILRAKGLRRVHSMRGGIEAWAHRIDRKIPRY